MAKKYAIMTRPQTGILGTLVPGPRYEVTDKTKATLEAYAKKGFAIIGSEKELDQLPEKMAKEAADKKAAAEKAAADEAAVAKAAADKVAADEAAKKAAEEEAAKKAAEEEGRES